ncbi:MAG TPA: hypothetical protein VE971_01715 [Candidatus Eisenbacteria bacterium]|nr:hypothetical protein [Candidatus Eisenbacteria bacterium]
MPYSGGNSAGGGENINHFGAVRVRVKGSGLLIPTLIGFDSVASSVLASISMGASPGLQPTVLANFVGQRVQLQLQTTSLNDKFDINRIIVFAKALYTSYPQ